MDTASPRRLKRSDRARQMREAQRRRRERLRQDNRRFLQIILPEDLRSRLYDMSEKSQQTLQDCVLSLIQKSLEVAMKDDVSRDSGGPSSQDSGENLSSVPGYDSHDLSSEVHAVESAISHSGTELEGEPVEQIGSPAQNPLEDSTDPIAQPAGENPIDPSDRPERSEEDSRSEAENSGEPVAEVVDQAGEESKTEPAGKRKKPKRPTNQMELF